MFQTQKQKRPASKRPAHKEKAARELSAGGVVFRRALGGVMFAMMKDSYDKWTFPKGHVEPREDIEEAAARETLEELGLEEIRLLEYLGKIDIWFRDKFQKRGKLIHKDIHYYLFEAAEGAELHADPRQHVFDVKWVPVSKVEKSSSYPDMVPIVEAALGAVKKLR
ncbi:NUDIX domain-containing protein [Candidatus Uhrbacteria bacterium]|nr:NUDIX domain-containing protein [Candidatus Uhrbacteria bacterium]